MPALSETQASLLDDIRLQGDDIPVSTAPSVTSEKYRERPDARVEVEDVVEEQNNETLRKKSKKSNAKSKGDSDKTSLLKSLVAEYSRDERAKKNRRGRKSANLSKF